MRESRITGDWATILPIGGRVVFRAEGRELSASKLSETGSALIPMAVPTGAWITRAEDQLAFLLPEVIQKKVLKMQRVSEPAVLVIFDEYGFQRRMDDWQAHLPPETSQFEAIVRVRGDEAELISGTLPA